MRFGLLSSATPTGLTSKAASASMNEYSRTTTRFASLGTLTFPCSVLTSIVSFEDDFLLELLDPLSLTLPQAAAVTNKNSSPMILMYFQAFIPCHSLIIVFTLYSVLITIINVNLILLKFI